MDCNTEVAMETKGWSDFVEYIINKNFMNLSVMMF